MGRWRISNVRFGSLAAPQHATIPVAAIVGQAAARLRFPGSPYLTVRFHQERPFKTLSNQQNDRPLTARNRRSRRLCEGPEVQSPKATLPATSGRRTCSCAAYGVISVSIELDSTVRPVSASAATALAKASSAEILSLAEANAAMLGYSITT